MSEVRPIDANALMEWINESICRYGNRYSTDMLNMFDLFKEVIDNAPTVKSKCKNCDHYKSYYKQFTNEPRGDGYCAIARMTSEGMTYINCTDEWSCADFCPKGEEK